MLNTAPIEGHFEGSTAPCAVLVLYAKSRSLRAEMWQENMVGMCMFVHDAMRMVRAAQVMSWTFNQPSWLEQLREQM